MAGKGAGARQLTLSDVRDYLIDTDAVKEAEKLLLSAKVGSHGSEDNTSKAKRDLERQRENATDVIRQRYKTGPREKREGVLDKLVVEKQHGKLGLLREEEEMRELLALEQLLRDESVTIERERMKVASETQNAKRSQILKFEKEAEQDLLQLETQRSNVVKELDNKRLAIESLQAELRSADEEMDVVTHGFNAKMKKGADSDNANEGEVDENSAESRAAKMVNLVTQHTLTLSQAQNERRMAEQEMERLQKGIFDSSTSTGTSVGLNSIGGTGTGTEDNKSKFDQAKIDSIVSEDSIRAQTERLASLKKQAFESKKDDFNIDSLTQAMSVSREKTLERVQQPGYVPQEDTDALKGFIISSRPASMNDNSGESKGMSDTLDAWLGNPSNSAISVPSSSSKSATSASNYALTNANTNKNITATGNGSSNANASPAGQVQLQDSLDKVSAAASVSANNNFSNSSSSGADSNGGKESKEMEAMRMELTRMREELATGRRRPTQEGQYSPQGQGQWGQGQGQGQVPNPAYPYIYPPNNQPPQQQYIQPPQYYGGGGYPHPVQGQGGYPSSMGSMGMQSMGGGRDPMQDMFMQQMQKMSEQMEKENKELLSQLNGSSGYSNYNNSNSDKRSGGRSHSNGNGNGPPDDHHFDRDRSVQDRKKREVAAQETKYADEIRLLDLEMERVRKQVELDELKYDIEKRTAQRKAEDEHNDWVSAQKKELQAMKMKQALAKEQVLLDMQTSKLQSGNSGNEGKNGNGNGDDKSMTVAADKKKNEASEAQNIKKEESGVGTVPLPYDLAKGISIIADGFVLPESAASEIIGVQGGTYRLVVGIYDKHGRMVTPVSASKWENIEVSSSNSATGRDNNPFDGTDGDVDDMGNSIATKSSVSTASSGSTKQDPHVLCMMKAPAKRLLKATDKKLQDDFKCLVEIQVKPNDGEQVSMGWGIMKLATITESVPKTKTLNNGLWKLYIRTGMSDPEADALALPMSADGNANGKTSEIDMGNAGTSEGLVNGGFIFIRVGDSADATRQYNWAPAQSNLSNEADMLDTYMNPLQVLIDPPAIEALPSSIGDGEKGTKSAGEIGRTNAAAGGTLLGELKGSGSNSKFKGVNNAMKALAMMSKNTSNSTLTTVADMHEHDDDGEEDVPDAAEEAPVKRTVDKKSVPWLLGTEPGQAKEKFQKGDGVDIYIDMAMYLPDNTTHTRCVAKFFNLEKEPVGTHHECYGSLSHSAMNPSYKFKIELRGTSLNITQTCLIRIDTLNSATMLPEVVGYACFKVFCNKDRVQPKVTNEPNVYVNTGLFQLRIRGNRVPTLDQFDETMLDTLPTIPCASLLVRLRAAPRTEDGLTILCREDVLEKDWAKLGLDVQAPAYTSGEYSGKACEPDEMETFAFPSKVPSISTTIDGALSSALSSIANKDNAPKFAPRPTSGGDDELHNWAKSLLPPQKEMKHILDYSMIAPYSLDSGLCVSVDMLFNMPEQKGGWLSTPPGCMYKVIYSIVPPGLYYKDPPMSEGVVFTKSEDMNRPYRAPVFQDGFVHFFPPMLDAESYVVIEVRSVTVTPSTDKTKSSSVRNTEPDLIIEPKSQEEKCFWTILPIAKERYDGGGYQYTMSGTYQLPLIRGAIPGSDLFSSETANPLRELLDRLGPKGKAAGKTSNIALAMADGCTAIIRVCNPLFRKMLPFASRAPEDPAISANDIGKLNTDMMNTLLAAASTGVTGSKDAVVNKFTYDSSKYNVTRGDKSTVQRLPGGGAGMDTKKLCKDVNKLFSQKSGIALES